MNRAANDPPVVVISGASGFVGAALARHLVMRGHTVRGLARNAPVWRDAMPEVAWFYCDLPNVVDVAAFQDADVFIHCAWETRLANAGHCRAVNVEGSRRLLDACRRQGVERIVFVSSMSAHPGALSTYGRTKLEVEAMLDRGRDGIVRPGHIIGEGGVFWRTARMIARLPCIPLFFGGRQMLQTVALADVCRGVEVLLDGALTGRFYLAAPEPVSIRDFYGEVARALHKPERFLQLPGGATLAFLRILEGLRLPLPLSSDNLLGLKQLRAFDVAESLAQLRLEPRSMREALSDINWRALRGNSPREDRHVVSG